MKWYFALSASSFRSNNHDWASLIRVSVRSAKENTGLRPYLLWDGPEHEFLDEMRALGVTVIFHRVSFYPELAEYRKDDPHGLATSMGCFLRVEIPLLEKEDEFVLYTDSDVMFMQDPVTALHGRRPSYFASSTEFTFQDGLNSGVMLINVPRMRADYPAFKAFITANLALGLDQTLLRKFYEGRWEKLPPEFNWKPYWSANDSAIILHWHGIKPVVVKRLFADPNAKTHPDLMRLVQRDPEGYKHYLRIYDEFLSPASKPMDKPPSSGRVAVVLVVKNEDSDILAWLAWYRLLGFDAAIIYDDDSTDSTWELLEYAASRWDIRLSRTIGPRDVRYQRRQADSYKHALATYKDEFEWLAFFDADEFLQLRKDKDVKLLLARFPDADEVAVNWCNYGSSGHALKPKLPAPLAYSWHSAAKRSVNRHVKCFVRPGKVGNHWVSVHCFDVAPERAVLANGQQIKWSGTLGITAEDPDWSVAKLMHYQCRSMEHFIERLKKRPQFQDVPNLWQAYDVRDEEDNMPLAMGEALQAAIAALTAPPANTVAFLIGRTDPVLIDEVLAKGTMVVAVQPDAKLYYDLAERFATPIAEGRLVLENFAPAPRGGEIAMLRPGDGGKPYHVATISWEELVAKHGRPARVHMGAEVPGYPAMAE